MCIMGQIFSEVPLFFIMCIYSLLLIIKQVNPVMYSRVLPVDCGNLKQVETYLFATIRAFLYYECLFLVFFFIIFVLLVNVGNTRFFLRAFNQNKILSSTYQYLKGLTYL